MLVPSGLHMTASTAPGWSVSRRAWRRLARSQMVTVRLYDPTARNRPSPRHATAHG